MPGFWGGEAHSGWGAQLQSSWCQGWAGVEGGEEAAGARQAAGSAGTFLSHEHSLQASNCRLPQPLLQPGPLSSPFQPPLLWLPQAPFVHFPDSPGDLSGKHRASFVFLHPTPFLLPNPSLWPPPNLRLSPPNPSQPASHFPILESPPLPFLPPLSRGVNLSTSQPPLKPICAFLHSGHILSWGPLTRVLTQHLHGSPCFWSPPPPILCMGCQKSLSRWLLSHHLLKAAFGSLSPHS